MAVTAGPVNGTLIKIKFGTDVFNLVTKTDIDLSHATRDATSKDSGGWAEKKEGLRSWKIGGTAWIAFDSAFGFPDVFALVESREAVEVTITTDNVGDSEFTGTAYVTSLKSSTGVEDTSAYDFELEGTGPLTLTVIV